MAGDTNVLAVDLAAEKEACLDLEKGSKRLRAEFDALVSAQQGQLARFSKQAVITACTHAVREAGDASDACRDAYFDGKVGDDEFLKRYLELRKVYHVRNAKLELLTTSASSI